MRRPGGSERPAKDWRAPSKARKLSTAALSIADLQNQLDALSRELKETREQQTATAEVLQIINSSQGDLAPVFDGILQRAIRLCKGAFGNLWLYDGESFELAAAQGPFPPSYLEMLSQAGKQAGPNTVMRRAVRTQQTIQIADYQLEQAYLDRDPVAVATAEVGKARTILAVPMVGEARALGVFFVYRQEVRSFSKRQMAVLQNFAAQAVIAMENARLFEELSERQAELRVTFDNMGDGVVMFDAAARLAAWNRNFQHILDLPDTFLIQRPSYTEYFRYLAKRGEYSADLEAELSGTIDDTSREMRFERTRPDGRVIEVRRNPVPGGGFVLIYADITKRKQAEEGIRAARDVAETALRELQMAQASLVHAQKMAALGQLTAGIAHEIKNPLNFVNNFADLSVELLEELKESAAQVIGEHNPGKWAEIVETIGMLTGNLEKIVEHGRRADGIVRSMLQHSRGDSGGRQATDLNALVEEALNLAYHGARAQDRSFEITLERDFDGGLALIEIAPQELLRVLLNLIGNGFYAASQRGREEDSGFRPTLKVATRDFGESIEVRVRDNGVGIPFEHREKLFQPFFTTKPPGKGSGLGLSISFEIVTQQHGGTIAVDSKVGDFTEFTVRLPRRPHAVAGKVG
jgi:two-component system NtrC family sensor kinase